MRVKGESECVYMLRWSGRWSVERSEVGSVLEKALIKHRGLFRGWLMGIPMERVSRLVNREGLATV